MTGLEIDRAVKAELRTLSKENAQGVGQHLIMVARLLDEDIELARAHADAAVRRAGRVPSVREARGMVAYHEGDWHLALQEFRTARRLSGSQHLLPFMIDCERALGRTEKAFELATSPEVDTLPAAERIEVAIVTSGIRRDLGQSEEALRELEGRHLVPGRPEPWAPRLYYAYADALLELGRTDDARQWFQAAAEVDADLQTDAWERLDELDGTVLLDLMDDAEEDDDVDDIDDVDAEPLGGEDTEGEPDGRGGDPVDPDPESDADRSRPVAGSDAVAQEPGATGHDAGTGHEVSGPAGGDADATARPARGDVTAGDPVEADDDDAAAETRHGTPAVEAGDTDLDAEEGGSGVHVESTTALESTEGGGSPEGRGLGTAGTDDR